MLMNARKETRSVKPIFEALIFQDVLNDFPSMFCTKAILKSPESLSNQAQISV